MKETIGWIGVGSMGHRMSRHLAKAGYPLVVADAVSTELAPPGATIAKSNAEVAEKADIIILSLPDGKVSEAVAREIASGQDTPRQDRDRHLHHRHQGGRGRRRRARAGRHRVRRCARVWRHVGRRQGHDCHHAGLPRRRLRALQAAARADGQAVPRRPQARARDRRSRSSTTTSRPPRLPRRRRPSPSAPSRASR